MQKNHEPKGLIHEYDLEDIRGFLQLTPFQRSQWLWEMNQFVQRHMPASSKSIWQQIREETL